MKPVIMEEGRIYHPKNIPSIEDIALELQYVYYRHNELDSHDYRCQRKCSIEFINQYATLDE